MVRGEEDETGAVGLRERFVQPFTPPQSVRRTGSATARRREYPNPAHASASHPRLAHCCQSTRVKSQA
ncbi:MAG: hypothetical protein K0Q89_2434 [Thermomicrobiales bacterium]|jgi:hypothetical protein|nr:hypothetical protein [Thermomicrobiales bacterium]